MRTSLHLRWTTLSRLAMGPLPCLRLALVVWLVLHRHLLDPVLLVAMG